MAEGQNIRNSQVSLGCSSMCVLGAFSCIVAATAVCNFVEITGTNVVTGETQSLTRGIWEGMSTVNSTCGGYSTGVNQDAKWKAAQAMSVLSCVLGGFAVWPLVCACGAKLFLSQVVSMIGLCVWASLCAGLTFLMWSSDSVCHTVEGLTDTKCRLDLGGNLAIVATALFFVASVAMYCTLTAAILLQELEANLEEQAANLEAQAGGEEAVAEAVAVRENVADPEAGNNIAVLIVGVQAPTKIGN